MDFSHTQEFPATLKTEWDSLLAKSVTHVPFLRYEYLHTWWQTRGGGEWPQNAHLLIITAQEGDQLVGVAPCFISQRNEKHTLLLLGSVEISDYLDLLVEPRHAAAFTDGIIAYSKTTLAPQYGIERIEFDNIPDNSPSLEALRSACQKHGFEFIAEPLARSPYIPLSGDYEEYLASLDKKQRHEMRRKMRRVLELPQGSDWYIVSDPQTLDHEIEEFLRLMAYEEHKRIFLTEPMKEQMRLSMRDAFGHHMLQLAFITIGGEKAAAYLNFDFNNRIWVYNSGIDPRFYEHSPGWVLLVHLIKWAIESNRFEFDFMRGSEDYKYKFGAVDRAVMRVNIDLKK
jgi:CelD/BcsL family acetyltransferase involved in cellulose biosynthesis